jgi:hypothetical protein
MLKIIVIIILLLVLINIVIGTINVEGMTQNDAGKLINDIQKDVENYKWRDVPESYHDAFNRGFYSNGPKNMQEDYPGVEIPLNEDNLDFFSKTKFAPECCPNTYSIGDGCACMSKDMMVHLNTRGGNKTHGNF